MHPFPESLLLLGVGLLDLLLAIGIAAIRTKPQRESAEAVPLQAVSRAS